MKSDKNFHIEISFSYPDSRKRNSSAIMLREKFSFRKKINGAEYFSNLLFKLFISALEDILSLYLLLLFVRKIIRCARESLESFVSIIQIDSDVRLLFVFT